MRGHAPFLSPLQLYLERRNFGIKRAPVRQNPAEFHLESSWHLPQCIVFVLFLENHSAVE
jgi:hypothetical protein